MYVYYGNEIWKVCLASDMFHLLKESNPTFKVEIESDGMRQEVEISELEDYSVVRNVEALRESGLL